LCFDYPQTRRGVNGPPPSVSVNCPRNSKPRAPYHSLFDWCSPRPQTSHPRHLTEAPGNGPRTSGPNFKKLSPGGVQHLSRKATGPASNPLKEIMGADWGVIIDARTAPERILKVRGHEVYRLPRFSVPANGTPFVFLQISAWGQLYNHTNPWVYALCVFLRLTHRGPRALEERPHPSFVRLTTIFYMSRGRYTHPPEGPPFFIVIRLPGGTR
jgi:hypothetical protein